MSFRFCFLLQALFFHTVSCDLFTGPGSFYKFSNDSNYIGDRVVYDETGSNMYYARDFVGDIAAAVMGSPSHASPAMDTARILQQSTSWLLIGDSTERIIVITFCEEMLGRSKRRVHLSYTDDRKYHAHCRIEISPSVTFQLANLFIFGYAEPTNLPLAARNVHPVLNVSSPFTALKIVTAALQGGNKSFLTRTFGSAERPQLISLHSCMWDLNEHDGIHSKFYEPYHPISYYEGAKVISHLVTSLAPHSQLIAGTCKPINDLMMGPITKIKTRFRDSQIVLDAMVTKLMLHPDNVIQDKVDMSMLLVGFEHFAADGRHYVGKAALTIVYAYMNSFERLFYATESEFLQTLQKNSTKKMVEHIHNAFLKPTGGDDKKAPKLW